MGCRERPRERYVAIRAQSSPLAFHQMAHLFASQDNTLKLWNITSGEIVRTFAGHKHTVNSGRFSPDGSLVVSGSRSFRHDDNTVRILDATTGQQLRILMSNAGEADVAVFSPDGAKVLVAFSGDTIGRRDQNLIRLLDAKTGQVLRTFAGHEDGVSCIGF